MGYRLHIDIPLGDDEAEAVAMTSEIIKHIFIAINNTKEHASPRDDDSHTNNKWDNVKVIQYRLGHDDDRTVRNYLEKDENGHASTKKSRIKFEKEE